MRVFLLDGWDFVEHVSIYHCDGHIVLAVANVVLQIHGVRVRLNEDVVATDSFIDLFALSAVDDEHDEVASESLLDLVHLLLAE